MPARLCPTRITGSDDFDNSAVTPSMCWLTLAGLSGWLYKPRDFKAPGPVVLSFHGGPEGQERPSISGAEEQQPDQIHRLILA